MSKQEKVFAKGFNFKRNENAPEWVVGKLSAKEDDAVAFIKANSTNGYVNMNIVRGQQGNYYIELDTWKPTNQSNLSSNQSNIPQFKSEPNASNDLPF